MDSSEERRSRERYNVGLRPHCEMEFQGRRHCYNVVPVIDDVEIWNHPKVALLLLSLHLLGSQVFCEYCSDAGLNCRDRHFDVVEIQVLARLQGDFRRIPFAKPRSRDRQTVGVAGIKAVEGEMP